MRIEADWLKAPELRVIFDMLEGAGHRAYVVGGAVRNSVMGYTVGDMDIATDARPERVIDLAENRNLKAIPTGMDHGTVTVISGDVAFEITTFRRDEETYGRKALVSYTDDIREDARRRDFTMNALYVGLDGEILDPVDGLEDAIAGRVRFIEDAVTRIKEDYLRILRFFRFTAVYGSSAIDAEALAAIAKCLDGLDGLARERIGTEMRKLLAADDPSVALASMSAVGALGQILPGAEASAVPILVHQEKLMGLLPDAMRRLAALGGEDAESALRLSRSEAKRLTRYRDGIVSAQSPDELGYRLGVHEALGVLALRAAMGFPLPLGWCSKVTKGAKAVFPISANDLMPMYEGPALGRRLREIEDEWIASGFLKSREALL